MEEKSEEYSEPPDGWCTHMALCSDQLAQATNSMAEAAQPRNEEGLDTGGRGGLTWQVHCEFVESF